MRRLVSFPRKRESSLFSELWTPSPAVAGTSFAAVIEGDSTHGPMVVGSEKGQFSINETSFGEGVAWGDGGILQFDQNDNVPSDLTGWTLSINGITSEIKKLWLVVKYRLEKLQKDSG